MDLQPLSSPAAQTLPGRLLEMNNCSDNSDLMGDRSPTTSRRIRLITTHATDSDRDVKSVKNDSALDSDSYFIIKKKRTVYRRTGSVVRYNMYIIEVRTQDETSLEILFQQCQVTKESHVQLAIINGNVMLISRSLEAMQTTLYVRGYEFLMKIKRLETNRGSECTYMTLRFSLQSHTPTPLEFGADSENQILTATSTDKLRQTTLATQANASALQLLMTRQDRTDATLRVLQKGSKQAASYLNDDS